MKSQDRVSRVDPVVLFACSGGSKAGELTDQVARKLQKSGMVLMSCVPAVSAQIPNYLEKLRVDQKVVVLDGCEKNCVEQTLKAAGFENYLHIHLNQFGLTREAPVKRSTVSKIMKHLKTTVANPSTWENHVFSYNPEKDTFGQK